MFEEICLVCGKSLEDANRAYCSDDCESTDLSSPSVSSSSSALSSPHIHGTRPDDHPSPLALGSALRVFAQRPPPTPIPSWAHLTDDDDEYTHRMYNEDDHTKALSFSAPRQSNALSYARLPSGINNRSTVPHPHTHRRTSSASSSVLAHAPHDDDSEDDGSSLSEYSFHPDEFPHHHHHPHLASQSHSHSSPVGVPRPAARRITTTPAKPSRGSLPSYFSLLQANSPPRNSALTSSAALASGSSTQHSSPTTPRLPNLSASFNPSFTHPPFHTVSSTLSTATIPATVSSPRSPIPTRGRSSRRSARASSSPSPPRDRRERSSSPDPRAVRTHAWNTELQFANMHIGAPESAAADSLPPPPPVVFDEEEIDWATAPMRRRGRAPVVVPAVSPVVLMGMGMAYGVEDMHMDRSRTRSSRRGRSRSRSRSRSRVGRGRERTRDSEQEREGRGRVGGGGVVDARAPGFGHGRSGLVSRGYAVPV